MSFTIQEKPRSNDNAPVITNWTPSVGFMFYRGTSIAGLYYYSILCLVYYGDTTGTLLATLKSRRNGFPADISSNYARAFFDVKEIVNSYLVDTVSDQSTLIQPNNAIHFVGANTPAYPFSLSGDELQDKPQIGKFTVKGIQSASGGVTDAPANDTSSTPTSSFYYLQASFPLTLPSVQASSSYMQNTEFDVYCMRDDTSKFLSDVGTGFVNEYGLTSNVNLVRENDFHTIAFINSTTDFQSEPHYIEVTYFDSSGVAIQPTAGGGGEECEFENLATKGGKSPGAVTLDTQKLLYFGCGPQIYKVKLLMVTLL